MLENLVYTCPPRKTTTQGIGPPRLAFSTCRTRIPCMYTLSFLLWRPKWKCTLCLPTKQLTNQQQHTRIVRRDSVIFLQVVQQGEKPDMIAYHLACIPKFLRENFSRAVQVEMKRLPMVPCECHNLTLPVQETDEDAICNHHCSISLSSGTHR
jgi:hypothetical protein